LQSTKGYLEMTLNDTLMIFYNEDKQK